MNTTNTKPRTRLPQRTRLDKGKPVSIMAYLNGWPDRSIHIFEDGVTWRDIRPMVNAKAKSRKVDWPRGSRIQVYVNQDGLRHTFWMEVVR